MSSFRMRLTFILIGMIGLSVLAAGLFMGKTYKDNHMDALQDNLVREMSVILDQMQWPTAEAVIPYDYFTQKAEKLKKITESRVTFIRGDGVVLGDSDHDPKTMDNHLNREEIQIAKKDGFGRSIRHSDTTNENLLYVAKLVDPKNPQSDIIRLALSLKTVDKSIQRIWSTLIVGLLILFVVAAVISYRVALGLTRPLEQITKVSKRIKNLDYKARVAVKRNDEIGELGYSINAMADSLQIQMARIHQNENQLASVLDNMINGIVMIDRTGRIVLINRCAEELLGLSASDLVGRNYAEAKQQYELSQIIQDGLERREHLREEITFYFPEERLLDLNLVPIFEDSDEFGGVLLVLQDVTAIRRLERMRSEFVANVSHELKTPVTAVKGFAETLLGGAVNDPETARSFLQIIFDESDRLNRLIGDILELSKVESRRIPLQFSPIELSSFIAKTIELMGSEAVRKNIRISVKVEPGIYVEADEDRLRQIIMNLLANGISYTPDGGHVSIQAEPVINEAAGRDETDYDHIRIHISDTGIGIPKKDLPRIFERFYRVDKARSRSSGGTGLGLSIVKHLVELHKGSISVSSNLGAGSTFTIELPVLQ
ncbi:PAS domain-containing sensor histidine kinase [Paenibacillus baekrokdamisoli]|uniref:histidine kinase n=1 Tax=Paenibacillus baekrokdamisoli TaxID=1712516 RepID=A0A3G9IIE0_9BACL|nr:sensor histidine kinase [Paenibacillus baekrokdamisoli]MBB3069287.1 two-component system phosphate regulon sensor histidine kinase PhoR [Paenibacillus baekrokdamisoli]BBH18740.1 PAS domain-containing sensor histidine kinase [Paenibacillus baekrokdamisoli]